MSLAKRKHNPCGTARLTWTKRLRTGLHILFTEFDAPLPTRAKAFSIAFSNELAAKGVTEVGGRTLYRQYYERWKAGKTGRIWDQILNPPNAKCEKALRKELRDAIANAMLQATTGATTSSSDDARAAVTIAKRPIRRRPRKAEVRIQDTDEESIELASAENSQAVVKRPALPISPPETRKSASPKRQYARPYGGAINLTDDQIANIPESGFTQPADEELHPTLPTLLFRFWSKESHGQNSKDGFVAGKYSGPDPNLCWKRWLKGNEIDPTDVWHHVENMKGLPSQWISVSSSFVWSLRNALKEKAAGKKIHLSVIDSGQLVADEVFYARPLITEGTKHYSWTEGKWRYWGSSEFWVWKSITKSAMLATWDLDDFVAKVDRSTPRMSTLMRLQALHQSSYSKLQERLKASAIELSGSVVQALADLMGYVGLAPGSDTEHIAFMIAEFIAGWQLQIVHRSQERWARLANVFACRFLDSKWVGAGTEYKVKMAFLQGVVLGLRNTQVTNYNVQTSPSMMQKLQKKARKFGLYDLAAILFTELEGAKTLLIDQQKKFAERFVKPAPKELVAVAAITKRSRRSLA